MKTEQMINSNVALSGMYKFSIQRADGTVEETGWMDNMILDSGLNQLAINDSNSLLSYLHVGTGTIPVDATQTNLQSPLAYVNAANNGTSSSKGAPLYQTEHISQYRFAQGSVVGNVTEVGVGKGADTLLFSRCLITDSAGVPTTLTVTASDQLIVYYKLTIFPDVTDSSGSLVLNGVTYNYVSRCADSCIISDTFNFLSGNGFNYVVGYAYDGTCTGLAPITGTLDGVLIGNASTSIGYSTYVPGSHQMTNNIIFSPTNVVVPIKAIKIVTNGVITQIVFTPSIPKTNINQLSLALSNSWGRG